MMLTRAVALLVGAFYLATGLWSFLAPTGFYAAVASFTPYNVHLLHDLGAFQVGLGLALVLPAALGRALMTSLVAVLGASLLHLVAHLEDLRLGSHPASDLPLLALVCVLLLGATVAEGAGRAAGPVIAERR
jgi:uncharacterized membrane protein